MSELSNIHSLATITDLSTITRKITRDEARYLVERAKQAGFKWYVETYDYDLTGKLFIKRPDGASFTLEIEMAFI